MSYRSLFTGDVHCSNNLPYTQRDPKTLIGDRLLDSVGVLEQMGEYADEHGIEDIWILGDLIDKRMVDAVTLKMVSQALSGLSSGHTVRLVPGNHEAYDSQAKHFVLDAFREMGIWVAAPGSATAPEVAGGHQFFAIPYQPDEIAEKCIKDLYEQAKHEPIVLLLHQTVKGGKIGSWVSPEGLDLGLMEPFSAALSGHFHTHQRLSSKFAYLGAPMQHNFGDRDEPFRGFWDVTFDDGKVAKFDLVPSHAPKFHELIIQTKVYNVGVGISPGDYVRLRVRCPESEVAAAVKRVAETADHIKRELRARYVHIVAEPETAPAKQRIKQSDSGGAQSWPSLVSGYIDVCDTSGLSRQRLEAMGNQFIQEAEG